jgi:hypothetical protein
LPGPSCRFPISNTGALSIELGPAPGNCIETFFEVELRTIDAISKNEVNSIAAIWNSAVRWT